MFLFSVVILNMYLNIVNNLSTDRKRNSNVSLGKKDEDIENIDKTIEKTFTDYNAFYNSIFYGQLTQNWIKVNN